MPHTSNHIILTKHIPAFCSDDIIPRQNLLELLNNALEKKLCLVTAAAGYGKTSLLSQWHSALDAKHINAAWLSLDSDDNTEKTFTSYLLSAVQKALSLEKKPLVLEKNITDETYGKIALTTIINTLSAMDNDFVIFLDNYQLIHNEEIHKHIRLLVNQGPRNLHIVIASREQPPLDISDLSLKNQLTTVSADELSFSTREIKQLFANNPNYQLTNSEAKKLKDLTEGWITGLKIAIGWLIKQEVEQENFIYLPANLREISNYFYEQVYSQQTEKIQIFLLYTAITERTNGDLANELCRRTDGWEVLEDLLRRGVFVGATDSENYWFRYHHLFRRFLNERLRRTSIDQPENIHEIATKWFLKNNLIPEATHHAEISDQTELIADALENKGGWRIFIEDKASILNSVIEKIPPKIIENLLHLSLGQVFADLTTGKVTTARQAFEKIRTDSKNFTTWNDVPLSSISKMELTFFEHTIAWCEDRQATKKDLYDMEKLSEAIPQDQPFLLALANNMLCLNYLDKHMFQQSIETGDQAISNFRTIKSQYGEIYVYLHQGRAYQAQGRLRDALALFQQAYDLTSIHTEDSISLYIMASTYLAHAFYEKNDIKSSKKHLENAFPHIDQSEAWFDVHYCAFRVATQISRISEGDKAAQEIINKMEGFSRRRHKDRLLEAVDIQRIIYALQSHQIDLAETIAAQHNFAHDFETIHSGNNTDKMLGKPGLILARIALAKGNTKEVLRYLDIIDVEFERQNHLRNTIESQLIRAITHHLSEENEKAFEYLNLAISKAIFEGYKRAFIDEGKLILPLLTLAKDKARSQGSNRLRDAFFNEVIAAIEKDQRTLNRQKTEILSPREKVVLQLASQGFSNKEIARKIDVTENTIKFHLKNTFSKLQANSRSSAIAEAERLAII